ncbi:MAG: PEP-CTERM sorting domain-containing protein [Kiritimatiellia bacterium]
MRAAGWLAALAVLALACTARAGILYWMIDGVADESFTTAYLATLEQAGGNADNVVARLYSIGADTGERIDYVPAIGLESEDDLGTLFYGWANSTEISDDPAKIYAVELGIVAEDGSITAYYTSDRQTYGNLVAMGAVQTSEVGVYDHAWNLAMVGWAAPEPSGAMLVLLGAAALLLRRKRNG